MGRSLIDSKIKTIVDQAFDSEMVEARACKEIIDNDYAGIIKKLEKSNSGLSVTNRFVKWVPFIGEHVWRQNNFSIKHNNEEIAKTLVKYMFYKDEQIKDVDIDRNVSFAHDRSLIIQGNNIKVKYYLRGSDAQVTRTYGYKTLNNKKNAFVDEFDRIDYANTHIAVFDKENPEVLFDQIKFSEDYDAQRASLIELSEKYDRLMNGSQIIKYAKECDVDEKKFKSVIWLMKSRHYHRTADRNKSPLIRRQQMLLTQ